MSEQIKRRGSVIVVPHPDDIEKAVLLRRYLIIRRSANVAAPRKLCFPGGGIEANETPEEAAKREFYEEVSGEIANLIPIWENITPWHVHLDWFSGNLTSPVSALVPAPSEVEEILWLNLQSLLEDPDTLTSNAPFLTGVLNKQILL